MKILNKLTAIIPALVLMIGLLTMPVLAEGGSGSTSGSGSGSNSTTSSHDGAPPSQTMTIAPENEAELAKVTEDNKAEVETQVKKQVKTEVENEIEIESKNVISELKKTNKEHAAAERKKNCDAAEKGLETKLTNLSKNASAFQVKITAVLDKAIAYQKESGITVANFATLVTAAKDAQAQSAASVSALNGLNANVDCILPGVAQTVASFKVAATKARTDLKSYKTAVKAVLKAIETAKGDK